ncbi:DEAD/DEAH box helicase [Microbacterium sp. Marseille-Q6965]|uniref:DEAD/DEAH box helicase n=1 Tax=Microbacterium sp. Marseille-Q6965 TaxID=2965072 RepID=UPI0021B75AA1|nr:DEAD/DEAH box helicase [Microbacterium sp. Marseille-Q6965]
MPKNTNRSGARAPKNFDPRYAKKSTGGPFRGHGRDDERGASRKPRWSADDRGARTGARDERSAHGERRFDGPRRDDRAGSGRFDRANDRGERRPYGNDRPGADRGERRSYGDRPERAGGFRRDDRPARDDRPRYDRDERSARGYGDRPARDDRARDNRDDRPARRFGDRPARDDRARFNRDDRARTDRFGGERAERPRYDRDDRPARRFDGERPRFTRDDRPARRFDRDERPARREFDGERPARRQTDGERAWQERREAPVRTRQQEEQIDVVHERLEAQAVQAEDVAEVTFGDLGLGDNIVRALAELGATRPFPIQASTAPAILDGRDVLARGRTGSGKTIAFGAPLVEKILRAKAGQRREFGRSPVALIMAPTRELALQIDRTVQPIARSVGLFTTQIYGGVPQARQVGALKKGVDIIIGTPGRIGDLQRQGKLDLSQIQISVLDEADHMCELGFLEPVQEILRLTSEGGQKLLFSATLDREVAALVDEFLVDPQVYEVAGETQETGTIEHRVLVVDQRSKAEVLDTLVDRDGKTLVFTRTRAFAEMLAEQFDDAGIDAISLHGDLNQAKRTRNIERFMKGRARVLVATDVAARGIHVDDVDLVIQADAPDEYKTYLHRAGRTGRAGNAGRVVTLITRQRRRRMTEMLQRAEIDAPFDEVRPGDDLIEELAGAPTVEELTTA